MSLHIISTGPDNPELLTLSAAKAIGQAEVLICAKRLLEHHGSGKESIALCGNFDEAVTYIKEHPDKNIAVLVTGDAGLYSFAQTLKTRLGPDYPVRIHPGISSLQYLCASVGCGYEDTKIVSLHGRKADVVAAVCYNPKVFVLCGDITAGEVAVLLCDSGLDDVDIVIGENLSMENERIIHGKAGELGGIKTGKLAVMLIENHAFSPRTPLSDSDFIRGRTPMTKEETRWIAVSKMNIQPCDVVYDIGAGTGSVSVEMARRACEGRVYAIEYDEQALSLIRQSRRKLGAYNIEVISGRAPEILKGLPTPDKAFIGGSGGGLEAIIATLLEKNPFVTLCVNAVTVETYTECIRVFDKAGIEADIVCVNTAAAAKVGGYRMMTAHNPVYIITGRKPIKNQNNSMDDNAGENGSDKREEAD